MTIGWSDSSRYGSPMGQGPGGYPSYEQAYTGWSPPPPSRPVGDTDGAGRRRADRFGPADGPTPRPYRGPVYGAPASPYGPLPVFTHDAAKPPKRSRFGLGKLGMVTGAIGLAFIAWNLIMVVALGSHFFSMLDQFDQPIAPVTQQPAPADGQPTPPHAYGESDGSGNLAQLCDQLRRQREALGSNTPLPGC